MLVNYLERVYKAEKSKFVLQYLLQNESNKVSAIDKTINRLVSENEQPVALEALEPSNAKEPFKGSGVFGSLISGCFTAIIPVLIVVFLFCNITDHYEIFLPAFLIATFVIGILLSSLIRSGEKSEYEDKCREYAREYAQYKHEVVTRNAVTQSKHAALRKKNNEIIAALNISKNDCKKNIQVLKGKLAEVENVLVKYYELNILFPKYHNMEAVCKMLEYLQSKRCSSLYGHGGAYDTFEKEYRMDVVINKFDIALAKMNQMQRTNIMLYEAVKNVNASIDKIHQGVYAQNEVLGRLDSSMGKSIGLLEQNAEATRLLTEIAKDNSKCMNEYVQYQNFATKQKRMEEGHWT